MTSNARVFSTLLDVVKGTYLGYPVGKAPPLPWFIYERERGGEAFADNSNYGLLPRYRVELYFEENDPDLIDRFEEKLSELGTYRLYDADLIDTEGCYRHDYRLTLLPDNE